jgi:hypothetical protein
MSFIARKALSNPPLRPLRILYDATVNDPLPSAREGGSIAIKAMRIFAKKAKNLQISSFTPLNIQKA